MMEFRIRHFYVATAIDYDGNEVEVEIVPAVTFTSVTGKAPDQAFLDGIKKAAEMTNNDMVDVGLVASFREMTEEEAAAYVAAEKKDDVEYQTIDLGGDGHDDAFPGATEAATGGR